MRQSESEPGWDQRLVSLLQNLSQVQDELLDVLALKQQCMARGDVNGMSALQPREEALCQSLRQCQQQRAELLEMAGEHGLPSDSLGNLANALEQEKTGQLRGQVKRTSSRMRLVQHQSLANWVLAQKALLHVSQMLEIIATGGRLQPTYGKEHCANSRGALVDQEA